MKLITQDQRERMLANGKANADRCGGIDFKPVVKLFAPDFNATWLLTELDPENEDMAFGLCDLGEPELGWVSLPDLADLRGPFGLPIERDRHFGGDYPLSVYARAARRTGCIVTDDRCLEGAKAHLDAERQEAVA
ncbi:DUF2958 domain-containing protein [Parerythrobacter lacustris]|uniref:DUF2958 domain-containing protein n=1 Tax=Parerythrobacter lacustris TaxID=2969984 RepID=A0ABT1XL62_9SPHN|nr:DUF2958 domain-containing protein [Parerythrobacter lacustris]MCR2832403.1 DUF2958 domain-containing protein [Parerythrobacter lacustris]